MGDFVFQRGEPRIFKQRRQPEKKSWRAHPGGTIGDSLVERGERLVRIAERGVDCGDVRLVNILALGESFEIGKDLPGAVRRSEVGVTDR